MSIFMPTNMDSSSGVAAAVPAGLSAPTRTGAMNGTGSTADPSKSLTEVELLVQMRPLNVPNFLSSSPSTTLATSTSGSASMPIPRSSSVGSAPQFSKSGSSPTQKSRRRAPGTTPFNPHASITAEELREYKDPSKKPPFSFLTLCTYAINQGSVRETGDVDAEGNPLRSKMLSLNEIYSYISDNFPFFKHVVQTGQGSWKVW
eukprot:scpid72043/ scgid5781/ Forkhead box protein J2; Fork head homologous X